MQNNYNNMQPIPNTNNENMNPQQMPTQQSQQNQIPQPISFVFGPQNNNPNT